MTTLTFDILNRAWNKVKVDKILQLKGLVTGLEDPSQIYMKRVNEDPATITVEFNGIQQAVTDPGRDIPQMNKVILDWIRRFAADAQIVRGDTSSLIVRMNKDMQPSSLETVKMNTTQIDKSKYEQDVPDAMESRKLTNIIRKRVIG